MVIIEPNEARITIPVANIITRVAALFIALFTVSILALIASII